LIYNKTKLKYDYIPVDNKDAVVVGKTGGPDKKNRVHLPTFTFARIELFCFQEWPFNAGVSNRKCSVSLKRLL